MGGDLIIFYFIGCGEDSMKFVMWRNLYRSGVWNLLKFFEGFYGIEGRVWILELDRLSDRYDLGFYFFVCKIKIIIIFVL